MSFDIITQILGIVGTTTGVLALLISYRTYTSAKPKLEVTVKKCEHYYTLVEEKPDKITINPQLSISNCGDRPTTLNEIEARFTQDGKRYKLKKEFETTIMDGEEILGVTTQVKVKPHDTNNEYIYFEGSVEGIQQEKIECNFKILHTHGTYSFKATSSKR